MAELLTAKIYHNIKIIFQTLKKKELNPKFLPVKRNGCNQQLYNIHVQTKCLVDRVHYAQSA